MSKGTSVHHPLYAACRPILAVAALLLAACSPKGEALYQRAESALERGEVRAAVIDLKNLVKDEPGNAKARALLAAALVENGEMAAAEVEIGKARELKAAAETLIVPECRVLAAKGEFDEVLARCKPESVPEGVRPQMHIAQGRALFGLERAPEAVPHFEAALAAKPDSLDALLGLASAAFVAGGLPAAQEVLTEAPAILQKQSRYWMAVGSTNIQGNDLVAAEAAFNRAIESVDKGADEGERLMAMGALAEAQMRQGKVKEAEVTTAQMVKAAPNNPLVKQLRAQVAAAGGNLDEARTLLEEAVAAMPENYQARTQLGIVNLQQGNLGQAEMHFSNVLANQPKNVQALRLLAETRARLTSPEQSLESLRGTLDAAGGDASMLAMAGKMSLASGDREQALAYLSQAASGAGGDQSPDAQIEVASGYLMAGDLDHAIELLEKMPESGATGFQREYLLMVALLRKGEVDKAILEAQALVKRSPKDIKVRNLVAGVYAAAGQREMAREQFEEALKIDPKDAQSLLNLARIDLAEGNAANAEARFRKVLEGDSKHMLATVGMAVAAAARNDTKETEKWLQKASTEHPDAVEAQVALAQFYVGSRQVDKALAVIDAAAKKSPDNAVLANMRGMTLLGKNDLPGALTSFKRATELAPKAYAYALNLARAHFANKDLVAALEVLDGVIKAEPRFLAALALAGAGTLQAGEIEKSAGYIARLSKAAPDSQITLSLEGDLAMAQKRYKDALQSYRKAAGKGRTRELTLVEYRAGVAVGIDQPEAVLEKWVAEHPDDPPTVAVLAEIRQSQGNANEAIRLYEQVLQKAPDDVVLLNNLAVLYQGKKDPRALDYAARAYKGAPKAASVQDTYGWLLFEAGQNDRALELLREANKSLPDNAEVQYHLAAALAEKGERAEAVTLLKKAVAGTMAPDQKKQAQTLLAELSK